MLDAGMDYTVANLVSQYLVIVPVFNLKWTGV